MTREHIFAHWLVAKVHGARLVPSGAPAAAPRSGPIAAVDRTVLARWFTKTAALLATAEGGDLGALAMASA